MKQVIDGKTYNTETATEIHNHNNGLGKGDFRYLDESLYKTPKGRFFLAGEGGAMTRYAKSYGNTSTGGSGIQAVDHDLALMWCEEHGVDTIEDHFEIENA